jgi:hydrogenase-4 component F
MIGIYLSCAIAIAISLFFSKNKQLVYTLLSLFLVLQVWFTGHAWINLGNSEMVYFTYDSLGFLLLVTLTLVAIPASLHSGIYIENHQENTRARSIYLASLVLLITSIGAGYLSNHIAVIWIFTELTTLSASAIIYHHRNKLALEGTWKYVFICAISITFIFIGILFLSLSLQHAGSEDLSYKNLVANAANLNPFWLKLAFLFIFTGFTAKLGLVPMFTAGIDAKDKAPAPAGALLASVLMNLGFIGIFRIYIVIANTPLLHWAKLVVGAAAFLSLFVATVYMLKVKNIKRMFAYSGTEHMGLVMLGVAAGGIGYYAAILHIVLHAYVKTGIFIQYTQLYRVFQNKSIYHVGNYFKYNPTGAMVLLFGFISASAMPPSGMFISELLIFKSLFDAGQILLLVGVLLLLTMIIWAFGKNMFKILFIPAVGFDETNLPKIKPLESLTQIILLLIAVYLGLNPPQVFVQLINDSILLLPL